MIIQSSKLGSTALAAPSAAPHWGGQTPDTLVIGVFALRPKDATVLRALIRLLDGSLGMCLRFSENPADCDVVFASHSVAGQCGGCATILVSEPGVDAGPPGEAITVASPLRMGSVISALQLQLSRLRPSVSLERALWLSALFERLQQGLKLGGLSTLPFGAGQLLQLDAGTQSLRSSLPLDRLLAQPHGAGALRPSTAVDDELLHGAVAHSLRNWLWRLSAQMLSAKAAHPPLHGAWRLLRWPQAAGLMAPGHPHLAALLVRRPYSDVELAHRALLPLANVQAFMLTCHALGLTQAPAAAGAQPPAEAAAATGALAPRWLQQVRASLKLW